MNWYELLNEMIDMRSFSNLWFWIALAVMWSTTSHWVLGVPFDMVIRAARAETKGEGSQAQQDLDLGPGERGQEREATESVCEHACQTKREREKLTEDPQLSSLARV